MIVKFNDGQIVELTAKLEVNEINAIPLILTLLKVELDSELGKMLRSYEGSKPDNAPLKANIDPSPGQGMSACIKIAQSCVKMSTQFETLGFGVKRIDMPKANRGIPIVLHELILKQIAILIANSKIESAAWSRFLQLHSKIVKEDKEKSSLAVRRVEANKPVNLVCVLDNGKVNTKLFSNRTAVRIFCSCNSLILKDTLELIETWEASDQDKDKNQLSVEEILNYFDPAQTDPLIITSHNGEDVE